MDITLDVYNKALEWYQSGVPGKKEAALELFSEEELEKGVSRYNKEKKLKIAKSSSGAVRWPFWTVRARLMKI